MKVVDLFAGCGGMSLGFENAGFDIVGAFDNWDAAIEIYRANFAHPIYKMDLNKDDCLPKLINIISGFTLEDNIEQSFENHGLHLRNRVVIRKALFSSKFFIIFFKITLLFI